MTIDAKSAEAHAGLTAKHEARLDRYVALLQAVAGENKSYRAVDAAGNSGRVTSPIRSQLLDLAPEARVFVDLGSGGGFPGIVLACALAERRAVMSISSSATPKKAAFLREASTRHRRAGRRSTSIGIERFRG